MAVKHSVKYSDPGFAKIFLFALISRRDFAVQLDTDSAKSKIYRSYVLEQLIT